MKKALESEAFPNLINKIILDNNGLSDAMFADVLQGLLSIKDLVGITYKKNEMSTKSLPLLVKLLTR